MKIILLLRTLISYFFAAIVSIIFITPALLILMIPKRYRPEKILFFILYIYYKLILYCLFMPIKITGQENIKQYIENNLPIIFVANHQSSLDIPCLGILSMGKPHLWLVLEYYKNKPIIGYFIKKLFVTVNQENKLEAAKSIIKTIKIITQDPQNIIIFPEGGRYIDGKIHNFFEGFAVIAQKTNYPVVPVYLVNNAKIYPPHSFFIYYNRLEIIIGKAMIIKQEESIKDFSAKVYNWFIEQNKIIS